MDNTDLENLVKAIDAVLAKHFSRENDERHEPPYNWNISDPHNELGRVQGNHGERVGARRMATALTALRNKRGKTSIIPKFTKLIEMTTEELNALGEKTYGSKWPEVLAGLAGGAGNNVDVKDVEDSELATEADGPVDPEASKAREVLRNLARGSEAAVKDVNGLSDAQVLSIYRKLK